MCWAWEIGSEILRMGNAKKNDNVTFQGLPEAKTVLARKARPQTDIEKAWHRSNRKEVGRCDSWETWRDQGRISDMETSPLPGSKEGLRGTSPIYLRLLSRVWENMAHEGTGQTAWWPFSGLVTNLGLPFSMPNMFAYTHVSAYDLVPSIFFQKELKEAMGWRSKGSIWSICPQREAVPSCLSSSSQAPSCRICFTRKSPLTLKSPCGSIFSCL